MNSEQSNLVDSSDSVCLIADSNSTPLARGLIESPAGARNVQIKIADGDIDRVIHAENIQIISLSGGHPAVEGHVIHSLGRMLVVEPTGELGEEVRKNLRMPISFESYIYPVDGTWKGRISIISHDLSCEGISFFTDFDLDVGEVIEVVIPITKIDPLILKCQILRCMQTGSLRLYAAKFINLLSDEEMMMREAVFSVQVNKGSSQRGR